MREGGGEEGREALAAKLALQSLKPAANEMKMIHQGPVQDWGAACGSWQPCRRNVGVMERSLGGGWATEGCETDICRQICTRRLTVIWLVYEGETLGSWVLLTWRNKREMDFANQPCEEWQHGGGLSAGDEETPELVFSYSRHFCLQNAHCCNNKMKHCSLRSLPGMKLLAL